MPSKVIIAAILALAVVFGVLFQLSLRFQDENLPPISFCCQNSSCTFEANTVTSKEIYAESYHNTKYKIDSRKLACEDYETIPIPSVQEVCVCVLKMLACHNSDLSAIHRGYTGDSRES